MTPDNDPRFEQTCETCYWWLADPATTEHGICHVREPSPTYHRLNDPEDITCVSFAVAIWPTTFPDDWCGQWRQIDDSRRRDIYGASKER